MCCAYLSRALKHTATHEPELQPLLYQYLCRRRAGERPRAAGEGGEAERKMKTLNLKSGSKPVHRCARRRRAGERPQAAAVGDEPERKPKPLF